MCSYAYLVADKVIVLKYDEMKWKKSSGGKLGTIPLGITESSPLFSEQVKLGVNFALFRADPLGWPQNEAPLPPLIK